MRKKIKNNLDGLGDLYRRRIDDGRLSADPAQELLVENLQFLQSDLIGYCPRYHRSFWKERLGLFRGSTEPPQGLYIYGGVGRGKSMLMDLFYETVNIKRKRRIHFHAFLQDVHSRFNDFRRKNTDGGDPVPSVVKSISEEAWLLCFDELQVVNIVDAMILGRLFKGLLERGVVIVTTSNRPPHDLYKEGLQREKFLPFIDLICQRLNIFHLGGARDYRLERMLDMRVYYQPLGDEADAELDHYFSELTKGYTAKTEKIEIKGRFVTISMAAAGVGRSSFANLCSNALGAADYLAIAERYHTLVLDRIPCMDEAQKNEARRFITLIDALYENKVNLICSANAPPEKLYVLGEGIFEFDRLVSRLMEMQSKKYLALPHGGYQKDHN
ncbi:MAG: cell division protein ZapE [Pseudomonadota bacterium]|nr:cell division protein ZapE [Pseudomonadota bacterium]